MEIDLLSAWDIWMQGHPLDGYVLWGLDIRWWGRIGQIVQMVSALTILAEIIGADRLRDFGHALHTGITLKKLQSFGRDSLLYTRELNNYMWRRSDRKEYERFSGWFPGISLLAGFTSTGIVLHLLFGSWWVTILLTPIIGAFFSAIIGTYLMVAIVSSALLLGVSIDVLIIEPIAWIIDWAAIDRLVKIGSILGLLVGFHFTLLAS